MPPQAAHVKAFWWYRMRQRGNLVSTTSERRAVELGNRIREERDKHGMSQEDLASNIYVSRQTVSNWETGKTYPDVQSLLLLSNLFGVTIDSLVKGDEVEMAKEIEQGAKKLKMLGNAMAGCMVVALVGAAYWCLMDGWVSALVWLVVFLAAYMVGALLSERIKKAHNLTTYTQIKAYMAGEDPAVAEQVHALPKWQSILVKVLVGAAAGGLLAFLAVNIIRALTAA